MIQMALYQNKDLLSKLKFLLLARVVVITVFMGGLFLVSPKAEFTLSLKWIVSLIIFTYFLTIIYSVALTRVKNLYLFSYIQILGDLLIETGIIFWTGGIESPFSFLYSLSIISASIMIYRRGGYFIASIASILYGVIANLEFYQVITPLINHPIVEKTISPQFFLYQVFLTISAFFLIASLSGYLSESLKRTGNELLEKRSNLVEMEEQVRRADKLAAIGRIAAGMAHEIRNPLASISGSIQMLKEILPLNGSSQKLMDIVLTETERLDRIIKDFIAYARPTPPQLQLCNINSLLDETIILIKNSPEYCPQIVLNLSLVEEGLVIWVDPDQIKQVFWNLSINALQAMPSGGTLSISTRWVEYPGRESHKTQSHNFHMPGAEIIIADTGIGISSQDKLRIFDPFFTTKDNGSGLGLAIVYRIIEEHKGFITVESQEGEGALFRIWLPTNPGLYNGENSPKALNSYP
jgi:two-component system sensor histidine kinase PilS (NtrC family)